MYNLGHHGASIAKQEQHEIIADEVEKFLSRGGRVDVCEPMRVQQRTRRRKSKSVDVGKRAHKNWQREVKRMFAEGF